MKKTLEVPASQMTTWQHIEGADQPTFTKQKEKEVESFEYKMPQKVPESVVVCGCVGVGFYDGWQAVAQWQSTL